MDKATFDRALARLRFLLEHEAPRLLYASKLSPDPGLRIRTVRHLISGGPEAVAAAREALPEHRLRGVWTRLRKAAERKTFVAPLYGPLTPPYEGPIDKHIPAGEHMSWSESQARTRRLLERFMWLDREELRGVRFNSATRVRTFGRLLGDWRLALDEPLERYAEGSGPRERRLIQLRFAQLSQPFDLWVFAPPDIFWWKVATAISRRSNLRSISSECLARLKARGLLPEQLEPSVQRRPPSPEPFYLDDGDFRCDLPWPWAERDLFVGWVNFHLSREHPRPGSPKYGGPFSPTILAHRLPKAPEREELFLEDTYPGINDIYGIDREKPDADWVIERFPFVDWPSSLDAPHPYEDAVEMAHAVASVLEPIHADGHAVVGLRPELLFFSSVRDVNILAFAERLRIERGARSPFPDDYAAPEAHRGASAPAVDVYSLGRVFAFWLTGSAPGADGRGRVDLSGVLTTVRSLVEQMIHPRPDARPDISDVRRTLWSALVAHFGEPM